MEHSVTPVSSSPSGFTSPQSADVPDPNDSLSHGSQRSLSASRPVLQYRKPGWRLRTFEFESKIRDYAVQKMRLVSIGQIVVGIVCLGFSVAVIAVSAWGYQIGAPVWGGALFTLAGGIGIVAFRSRKLGFVLATFLLNCGSFLTAFVLFVVSCVGIEQDLNTLHQLQTESSFESVLKIYEVANQITLHKYRVAFNAVLLFLSVVEVALAMAHALLNGRHFFVWDEGCTSESPYVYSNAGAEIEPELPPTYQEAMGITIPGVSAPDCATTPSSAELNRAVNSAHSENDNNRGGQSSRYPVMESAPAETGFIEMQAGGDWENSTENQVSTSRGNLHRTDASTSNDSEASLERTINRPSHSRAPEGRPAHGRHDQSMEHLGLRLGRGDRTSGYVSPMYRRPHWPPPPQEEPIYANLQDFASTRPYDDGESEPAPQRSVPTNIDQPDAVRRSKISRYPDSREDWENSRRAYDQPSDHSMPRSTECLRRPHASELDYYRPDPSDLAYYRYDPSLEVDVESHM